MIYVKWRYYGDRNFSKSHLAIEGVKDIGNGSFPLECGIWVPDGWDAQVVEATFLDCKRCQKVRERRTDAV